MTAIELVELAATPYTWASADFTWESATAGKSWETANIVNAALSVDETLAVAEVGSRVTAKAFSESFGIADSAPVFDYTLNVLRNLHFSETYTDNVAFNLRVMESLSIADSLGKHVTLPFDELISITDHVRRDFGLNVSETLAIAEQFGRAVAYHLYCQENISIAEAQHRAIGLNKNEALHIFEEYRRHGNAVLSDLIVQTAAFDLRSFQELAADGHAAGYAPFKDFIPGNYNYRHAMFRALVESTNADRARLTGLSVQVDVPDVFDRGSATITPDIIATGLRVNFTRQFHIVPEITMNVKGGTVVCIPRLLDSAPADNTGFTAVLLDVDGNPVAGSFTWAAHGY